MMVMHDWLRNEILAYAEDVGNAIVTGGDWSGLLDHPPWPVKFRCYGRMDWLSNEISSNVQEYTSFNSAARDDDESSINECLAAICEDWYSEGSFDWSERIVYKAVEAIRMKALSSVSMVSLGISDRAEKLFKASSGVRSQGARNASIDIATFSNSIEYVDALFTRSGEKDLALMRGEWSFAVGVPDDYPETFPVMISSNVDLACLAWERLEGTNFCGHIEVQSVPRCGNGQVVVVCKSGKVRKVDNAAVFGMKSIKNRLVYRFDLREIFGVVPQSHCDGLYYLTPIGKMTSCFKK